MCSCAASSLPPLFSFWGANCMQEAWTLICSQHMLRAGLIPIEEEISLSLSLLSFWLWWLWVMCVCDIYPIKYEFIDHYLQYGRHTGWTPVKQKSRFFPQLPSFTQCHWISAMVFGNIKCLVWGIFVCLEHSWSLIVICWVTKWCKVIS